jgi:hypothetical protein
MRKTLRWGLAALLLLTAASLGLGAAALQGEPAVVLRQEPDADDVARALALVHAHDPRKGRPGVVSAVRLSERDLELLLGQAGKRWPGTAARISIGRDTANLVVAVHLPPNPLGRWLNLDAELRETGALPVLESVRVGGLPVPAALATRLLRPLAARAGVEDELKLAGEVLHRVRFEPGQADLIYAWRDDSAERMLGTLVPAAHQQRLRAYADRLVAVAATQAPTWSASMAVLMGPMFELARQRSALAGADAAAENRAALMVLTLFVNGRGVDALLPAARDWPKPRALQVLLGGRDDFPRHLLVSAALAAEGGGPLSKVVGVYKEVADSRGGSGFSFNDIAADLAGTRLGELAVAQPQKLQAALAGGVQESDLMPPWADLPEFMPEPEFKRRYGGVGAPAYLAMMADIERRVGALPALR